MSKLSKLASAMPFAHYLGLGGSAAAAAEEDEERKQGDDESDEDYAKRMEEMDEEEEKARKAEEDEKEKEKARKAEEEEKEKEKAKKAKRAEDGDDDSDLDDDESAKAARQRERIRCARILAAGIKAGRVNQACVFAFDSHLSSSAAVAAINAAALDAPAQPAARRPSIDERMAAVKTANPGASAGAAPSSDQAQSAAARIIAAGERARSGK